MNTAKLNEYHAIKLKNRVIEIYYIEN